jgi:hypothetical protein
MEKYKLPVIEEGLLHYLERLYPDKAPDPNQTDRDIWINVGAVGVVRHLRRVYEEQNENLFNMEN